MQFLILRIFLLLLGELFLLFILFFMTENNILADHHETAEEVLGPARIDAVGLVLMAVVGIVVGGLISIAILITSFFSIGKFSIESGVSPVILAMTTFFSLTIGSSVYLYIARSIFPAIYTRARDAYKHTILFMLVLYICMMPIYLMAPTGVNTIGVLIAYLIHILLAVFGMELVIGVISQYRYILLAFYANLAALVLSGGIVFSLFQKFSQSSASLFVLM